MALAIPDMETVDRKLIIFPPLRGETAAEYLLRLKNEHSLPGFPDRKYAKALLQNSILDTNAELETMSMEEFIDMSRHYGPIKIATKRIVATGGRRQRLRSRSRSVVKKRRISKSRITKKVFRK